MRTKKQVIQYRNCFLIAPQGPVPETEYNERHERLKLLNWIVEVYETMEKEGCATYHIECSLKKAKDAFDDHFIKLQEADPEAAKTEEFAFTLAKLGVLSWVLDEWLTPRLH